MRAEHVLIRDRVYIPLPAVAECYQLEIEWLREVYEIGLLGAGERIEQETVIELAMLDRVAAVWRLNRVAGVNLEGVVLLLGPP